MGENEEETVEISFDDDVEGDVTGSDDYCFVPVGEPVPIVPVDDEPVYDSQNLPLRPFAVSEKLGVLFVSHSNGFFVARTKEVIQTAKEIKEKKSGLSIKESCIVDVLIGKVYILALSVDSSTLAASVAGNIHFFSVRALLNKEQNPYFSSSLGDSSSIRDMQWTKRTNNQYVILSDQGKLYYGADQHPLKHVMDNVDSVEWSVNGKFLAVATKNFLSILSSKFKKKISISLSFKTWVDDSDFKGTIKVDSIRWIRPDCIILGCFQLGADGTETDYLIQVVTSKHGKITDASSEPTLLSFSYVFQGLVDDIVPYGSGPYMSLGYVANCELAIAANRKNTDQHIVLLGWPQENVKQVALIDNLRDTLRPKISLQENGDDNIVLGLCLDKVTYNDKVEVVLGADYKELSPFCLLLCLSLDGKLSMFQVASATGVSSLSGDASFLSEEEVDDSPTAVFSENGSSDYSDNSPAESAEQDYLGIQIQSPEVNKKEPYIGEGQFPLKKTNLEESANFINSKNLITEEESKFSLTQQIQHTTGKQSPLLAKQGTDARQLVPSHTTASFKDLGHTGKQEHFAGFNSQLFPTNSSTSLFSQTSSRNLFNENDSVGNYVKTTEKEKPLGGFSSQLFPAKSSTSSLSQSTNLFPQLAIKTLSNENNLNKEIPEKQLGSATFKAAEERKSFPNTSYSPSSILPSGYNQSNSSFTSSYDANLQGGSFGSSSNVKSSALPANHKSTMPFQSFASPNYSSKDQRFVEKDNKRINSSGRVLSSEPRLSKQSGNVEEMIKELEELLERIEGPGGYREACTVLLDGSVLELEKGMGTLFGRWRQGKRIMDEQLLEVQSFRDKTVQVAAKKFYMEGIIKQASDDQYWDLWNKQKLSPELELKRQHILKVNQELTSQLIELERHLHTLEIKAFGEDRGQMRQRGLPTRYGSSRHGQSLRSLQEIMNSQLAAAEQLSESLSRQMNLLSVESPNTKKADARRELFEEIGIPYSNASFGSPEKERAIDNTPSNKKVLVPLNSGAKSSSRRNQLTAVKILGCESSRRRRDSLDRSWASFEPPKTTVKRETRRTPNVDRSSLLMGKEHIKSQVMDRSAFAPPELRTTPLTTLQSSNDIGAWERTSKQAFETSSALPQAYKTPDFSKRSSDQTFSLSRNTNETKSSDIFVTSKDVPNKFQPDNAANKNKNLSGLFPFSSSQFSIFGSSSSLNSSSSVPSTISVPSSSSLSPAVATNKASSFKLASSVTQPVVPSLSPASSATVFKGSSFTLNSSLSVPSTSPTPSIAPSLPTISFGNSFSTLKPSTTDSNAVLPSLSSVSPPLPFGKPVSSLTSTPSTNLPNESLEKETQPPKPENSNKVEDNGSSIQSSIPTSDASTLFQSVKIPSLNSTGPAVQDASNSVLERKITTDVVSPAVPPASEIEKIENQEDDMEEEAPETNSANQLNLGGLGGFGLGSSSNSNTPKQNPFGSSFANTVPTPILSPMPVPSGELFRPPSFSLSPPTQPPQPTCGFGAFSGNTVPTPTQSGGFGQPSKIGAGQQALGSLLGSFGQSRQFAAPTPSPVGGFGGGSGSTPPSGGFAGIASGGGGFASLASGGGGFVGAGGGGFGGSPGGGFAGAASPSVGGFGGAATPNVGGFASAAGGFAGAAPGGGGFGGAAPGGGFGGFNSQQGGGGFSSFGNNAGGTGTSPSALFTQMRK